MSRQLPTEKMNTNSRKFVDHKNRLLFDSIVQRGYKITHNFQTQGWPNAYPPWLCENFDRNKKTVTIKYYEQNPKTFSYYTHELFHIDQIDKGFLTNFELLEILTTTSTDYYPIGHINNIIAHQKFYQDFINLGYTPSEFVVDHDVNLIEEINNKVEGVKNNFTTKSQMEASMADYIGMFFSFTFNPDDQNKYTKQLHCFKQIDNQLYKTLDDNWNFWISSNSLDNLLFFKSLVKDLDIWRAQVYNKKKLTPTSANPFVFL